MAKISKASVSLEQPEADSGSSAHRPFNQSQTPTGKKAGPKRKRGGGGKEGEADTKQRRENVPK